MWLAMVGALQQQGDNVGTATAARIKIYMGGIRADQSMTNDVLASDVKYCRVACARDRATVKIFLEASQTGIQKEVVEAMVQLGAAVTKGTPPKSHQGRLLQMSSLDAFEVFQF